MFDHLLYLSNFIIVFFNHAITYKSLFDYFLQSNTKPIFVRVIYFCSTACTPCGGNIQLCISFVPFILRLKLGGDSMFQDFGLDVEAFRQMVGDCPPHFFNLTVICCSVRPLLYCHDRSYIILPCKSLTFTRTVMFKL